jgi:hypothetical protein
MYCNNDTALLLLHCDFPQRAIRAIVDESVLDRSYPKALECLKTLRTSCISLTKGRDFNTFLEQLQERYKQDSSRSGFWGLVVAEGLGPVHNGEDPSVELSEAQAEEYMKRHGQQAGGWGFRGDVARLEGQGQISTLGC